MEKDINKKWLQDHCLSIRAKESYAPQGQANQQARAIYVPNDKWNGPKEDVFTSPYGAS